MDFVTFEIAKKRKEKGFTLPKSEIIGKFDPDGLFHSQLYINFTETMDLDEIIAPTISQVLEWLREEKETDIILYPIFLYNENNREREYGIEIHAPQLNKPVHLGYFKECEKGANAGIEYVLDNLIN